MPNFRFDQLHAIAARILRAAGVPHEHADTVAAELANANLVGHDSHGVIRLMQYADYVVKGFIRPAAQFEVIEDAPAFAIIDGHFQFGQVIATAALQLAMEKARGAAAATVVIRNCNHVGRLGSYTQQAAEAGFAAMMCVNAPGPGGVVPFGGIDRRLGTNPISLAAPRAETPIVLDMTSSATAEGKVRVALQKGEKLPEGWIIDCHGNPSTNPADLYGDGDPAHEGAILPLGGAMGHKGFGLSVMIDVFAGILSGSGICRADVPRGANGVWLYVVDVNRFIEPATYAALVEKYVAYLKSARLRPGVKEILLPGEVEFRTSQQRTRDGIPVPDETWRQVRALAEKLGAKLDQA